MSNAILEHFQQAILDPATQRLYNTVVGIEVPGLNLNGRTFRANHDNEIDIIALIAHGEVNMSGSDIVSKLGFRSSLFTAAFEAFGVAISKTVVFDRSRFEQGVDFRQALFGKGVSFYNATIEGDLDLSHTTIHGELNLQNITVHGDVLLGGATIEGDLELEGAEISGELNLNYATVKGAVRAKRTETKTITLFLTHILGPWISDEHEIGSIEWTNSQFESSIILVNCTIHGSFRSERITIEGGFSWYRTTAEGAVRFINSQFKHVSVFQQGEIQGPFDVRRTDMGHHFWLIGLDVEKDIILAETELGSYTLLHDIEVTGDLLAASANAAGVLGFDDVTVGGETVLADLTVGEHLEFHSCTFESSVDLSKSVVHEYIVFEDGTFESNLAAENSRVGRNFEIIECTCSGKIDLTAARIGTLSLDEETKTASLILEKTHVTERIAVLDGITVCRVLSLKNANFHHGLKLASATVGELSMDGTEVAGAFVGRKLTVGRSTGGSFSASDAIVSGKFLLEEATINGQLDLQGATIHRKVNTDLLRVTATFSLSNAHIGGDIGGKGMNVGALNLTGVTFESGALFHRAVVRGNVDGSQVTATGSNITFFGSRIQGAVSFKNANLAGDLIIAESKLEGMETDGSLSVDRATATLPDNIPYASLNTGSAVIGGFFLIEDSYIWNTVYATGAKLQAVTLKNTTVTGSYYIDETEITETLTISNSSVFNTVEGADLRISSKCKISKLTAKAIDFDDSLFKWNVTISKSLVGEATLENATFRNVLRLQEVMTYNGCIRLNRARVTDISIIWARGSTTVECEQARLGNLKTKVPGEGQLWDRLHINRTQFDEFDFADFTPSLSHTNHLIHRDEKRSRRARYRSFFPELLQHGAQLRSGDLDDLIETYEDREVTYRRAKDNANTTGDNPAASKFYMHEKKYRRRRQFWTFFTSERNRVRNGIAWITNLALGVLAGHGERASQVGLSAIAAIITFGLLFSIIPLVGPESTKLQPIVALEQSLRTFVGASSLVKQDGLSPLVQQLMLVERALGIAFIPLLVFALTRSLHR